METLRLEQRLDLARSEAETGSVESTRQYLHDLGDYIDEKESVFLHELTHCLLEMLEYNELSHNEQLVETFSRALHQAIKTMK